MGRLDSLARRHLARAAFPTLALDSETDLNPRPEESTEEWLDLSASAGRLVVHVDQDHPKPWDSQVQAALAASDLLESLAMISLPTEFEHGLVGLSKRTLNGRADRDRPQRSLVNSLIYGEGV